MLLQLPEVGPVGVPGLDVQSAVEVEPGPDPDLVPIRHLNMEDTTALDPQRNLLDVTIMPVSVSISMSWYLKELTCPQLIMGSVTQG